jgi:glycerol-3-phosphate dehydrogenase (NAD(P)+)
MSRLGAALGAEQTTFAGLAGLGDLVATCSSPLSRNRTVGEQLGRGRTIDDIVSEMRMVAEGVKSSQSIVELAHKHDVEMPIAEGVVRVVHEGISPGDLMRALMGREAKSEVG